MSAPVPYERHEQLALIQWLDLRGIEYFSCPNEGKRNPVNGRRMKQQGLTKGAPDLVLLPLTDDGSPVMIEMKRAKGGRLSQAQRDLHATAASRGWYVVIGFGAKDAIEKLEALGF